MPHDDHAALAILAITVNVVVIAILAWERRKKGTND